MKILIFGAPKDPNSAALAKDARASTKQNINMINIYKKPELAIKYNIKAFPTTVAVLDDDSTVRLIGDVGEVAFRKWLMENNIG